MFKAVRRFFEQRNVCEVDCPILSPRASVDAHIDLIPAFYHKNLTCYLHSSPEYGMKRLLAEGMGDIFQLAHVFRDGEWGPKHNPEFMMAEWYRLGFTLEQMIEETIQFIRLFLGELPYRTISYRDLFMQKTGIDTLTATVAELFEYIEKCNIPCYPTAVEEGKDALLNLILASQIEQELGFGEFCVLAFYPASQAALARKRRQEGGWVAERFEVYFKGMELANGYHELTDAVEQRQRFMEANAMRIALNKDPLPLDENFLKALHHGLPDCSGVAVGFDRLMMLRQSRNEIAEVLPWGWKDA
jgi:elongation factor P--(R)-beta-lysine ligase